MSERYRVTKHKEDSKQHTYSEKQAEYDAGQDAEQQKRLRKTGELATAEALKDDIDSLLDEIDEVLEQNAETFVRDFVQKGGE